MRQPFYASAPLSGYEGHSEVHGHIGSSTFTLTDCIDGVGDW